jgi:MerR family transcriptional regulator, light-induced transcriptional regulator
MTTTVPNWTKENRPAFGGIFALGRVHLNKKKPSHSMQRIVNPMRRIAYLPTRISRANSVGLKEAGMRNLFNSDQTSRNQVKLRSDFDQKFPFVEVAGAAISALAQRNLDRKDALTPAAMGVSAAEARAFTQIAIESGESVAIGFVENLLRRGVTVEQIYLQLLGPSARELGDMWDSDMLDFARMTIAVWRIQQALFLLSDKPINDDLFTPLAAGASSIYIAAVPGSQHTLGVQILGDIFRREGWAVSGCTPVPREQILHTIATQHVDVIGLSIATERLLNELRAMIPLCRLASKNKHVAIIAGGALLSVDPERFDDLGVNFIANDAMQAVHRANQLVSVNRAMSESTL